jgi:hypothetical protein
MISKQPMNSYRIALVNLRFPASREESVMPDLYRKQSINSNSIATEQLRLEILRDR